MTPVRPDDGREEAIGKGGDVLGEGAGFTLLEVLAAAVVLVIAVAAGTGIIALALTQSSRDVTAVGERDAALEVQWRLAGLPYVSAAPGEESLVAALFPHATVAFNTPEELYVPAADGCWPGPAFVTYQEADGRRLAAVAQFLWRTGDGGWVTVPRGRIDGACFDVDTPPPVLRLELRPANDPSRPALLSRVFVADCLRGDDAP